MSTDISTYPVRVEGRLDPGLSRWLWLLKWLLVIPHYVVLAFLWVAFGVLSVVAFFAILFTGRYPRGIFEFNVGVLRWTWRVGFYAFAVNGTDRYPPFSLREADYPALLQVDYPERLSRGLVLVKWWLLAIPHYLVVAFFVGGGTWLVWQDGETAFRYGGGLIGVLVLIAVVALLFTGRYPRTIFDLVLGLNRWAIRVAAYAGLMTDRYPPFRLDMGGSEPGAVIIGPPPPGVAPVGSVAHPSRWTAGRILLTVFGSIATLVAAGLVAAGGAVVTLDQSQRGSDGYLMSPTNTFTTATYALVSERIDIGLNGPDWLYRDFLGTVQLRSESTKAVFVGIGRASDVDRYLGNVRRAEVTNLGADPGDYDERGGTTRPDAPVARGFWAASVRGAGEHNLRWDVQDGSWQIVVMNADGSPGVDAELSIGAELPNLVWIGVAILGAGGLLLAVGVLLIYLGVRTGGQQEPGLPERSES
jgi:Domain of unknown function (DUF4389)